MNHSRFSQGQIIVILKQHQAGMSASELCRKHGISGATFCNWRSKYGGMEVSEAKRLKQLYDKNAKLNRLLAEQNMDIATPREMLQRNFGLARKRGEHQLRNQEVFYGQREQTDVGVSA